MHSLHLIALGTVLAIPALAQPTAVAPQPVAQRDPQALSLLSQSWLPCSRAGRFRTSNCKPRSPRPPVPKPTPARQTLTEAAAYDKGKMDLGFTSGRRAETRNGSAGVWSAADAQNHPVALHNTWTAAAWFAPALVIQSWVQDSSFSLSYAGLEDRDGAKVLHIVPRETQQAPRTSRP